MTLELKELTPAEEILAFLDDIEGDGYGGMAMFEIARQHAREMVRNAGVAEALVADLVYSTKKYAQGGDKYDREDYLEMKQKVIDVLTSTAVSRPNIGGET